MNLPLSSVQQTKIGTCPHGLPQGACPICSGMGGGGGASTKANKNEMSWSECYVQWQQMQKAKQNPRQLQNEAAQAQMISQYKTQLSLNFAAQNIGNIASNLANFIQKTLPNSSLSQRLLAFSAKLALPVLNAVQNVLNFADKVLNVIKEKMIDISDKLNAIFGELKNSIEKKISDKLKDFKKKFKTLFGITDVQDTDEIEDEEKRIEESKRLFELKTVFHNILKKLTSKTNTNEQSSKE